MTAGRDEAREEESGRGGGGGGGRGGAARHMGRRTCVREELPSLAKSAGIHRMRERKRSAAASTTAMFADWARQYEAASLAAAGPSGEAPRPAREPSVRWQVPSETSSRNSTCSGALATATAAAD